MVPCFKQGTYFFCTKTREMRHNSLSILLFTAFFINFACKHRISNNIHILC